MKKQPRIDRSCERCGSAFVAKQSDVDKGNGRFCSRICHVKSPKRPKTQQACEQCGKEFMSHQCAQRKFCSLDCAHKSQSGKVLRACKQCGKQFSSRQCNISKGKALFCSKQCWKESPKPAPVVTCGCCGKVFADHGRNNRKYCSPKCYQTSRPQAVKAPARPHEHDKWALAVILRDKKCVRCEATENLQAHHVKSWRSHPDLRYVVSNGVALCPLCHHAQHPKLPLEQFIASGGKKVQYCVVCETAFLVRKKTQRVCSRKCGWKRTAMQRPQA